MELFKPRLVQCGWTFALKLYTLVFNTLYLQKILNVMQCFIYRNSAQGYLSTSQIGRNLKLT